MSIFHLATALVRIKKINAIIYDIWPSLNIPSRTMEKSFVVISTLIGPHDPLISLNLSPSELFLTAYLNYSCFPYQKKKPILVSLPTNSLHANYARFCNIFPLLQKKGYYCTLHVWQTTTQALRTQSTQLWGKNTLRCPHFPLIFAHETVAVIIVLSILKML